MISNETQQPGHNICPLCGKVLTSGEEKSKFVEVSIDWASYRFDSKDCVIMFKRFLSVYGDDFKRYSGHINIFQDPFWDRAIPKEDELKEIEAEQLKNISDTVHEKSTRDIVVISDALEIQQLGFDLLKIHQRRHPIIFSTGNAFLRQVRIGGIQLFKK